MPLDYGNREKKDDAEARSQASREARHHCGTDASGYQAVALQKTNRTADARSHSRNTTSHTTESE